MSDEKSDRGSSTGGAAPEKDFPAKAADLHNSSAFLNLIIENIPAMVAVKDAEDLRFILGNRAGDEMTGYPRSETLGKTDFDLFPKEQAEAFIALDREVLAGGELRVIPEEPISTRYRGVRILRTLKMPVLDEAGRPKYLLAMSEDITERKAAEAALHASEMQLRQAIKMEAIGGLTGGLAHDFNNLLSVIIGNLDLLRERLRGDPESDDLASQALSAALHGADLTRRLLAFARRQPLEPKQIDVNELVTGITALLGRTLGGNIDIEHRLGEGIWPILADPAQLEACIVNIVTNARDAMPNGGRLLVTTSNRHLDEDYAGLHPELTPGDYSLIEISDTGTGMAPETLTHIFEPFFTTKPEGRGTGLGLSMVFGFMKQSGGHINVYSELGAGTTFRLYLPRAEGDRATDQQTDAAPVARSGAETVLAVEDNPNLRNLVVRQLTQLGYTCLEAGSGAEALRILENDHVDLLFTDVIMPGGMSGYDLGLAVRARWPSIKVLLTSGFPEEKLGGYDAPPPNMRLLTKPYRKDALAKILREVLDE
jgi:PAS domain S-box-containing protein